jgi:hypothetical protein
MLPSLCCPNMAHVLLLSAAARALLAAICMRSQAAARLHCMSSTMALVKFVACTFYDNSQAACAITACLQAA